MSSSSISISSSSSSDGSSSITMARLRTCRANVRGMVSIASSTSSRKCSRVTWLRRPWRGQPSSAGCGLSGFVHHARAIEIAIGRDIARGQSGFGRQMRRPCRISVVRGARPSLGRQHLAQLRFDLHRIVILHEADAIGDAQHVTIDGQTRARRAHARARRSPSCGRRRAA